MITVLVETGVTAAAKLTRSAIKGQDIETRGILDRSGGGFMDARNLFWCLSAVFAEVACLAAIKAGLLGLGHSGSKSLGLVSATAHISTGTHHFSDCSASS